jgi:hypothetical protein
MRTSLAKLKSAACGLAISASLLVPGIAFAQQGTIQGNLDAVAGEAYQISPDEQRSLPVLVGTYINAFLAILGIFFVIYIIIAGFKLFTSSDPKALADVQNTIKNAVIGLIIIFAAYAISNFVIQAVLNSTGAGV